MLYPTINQLTGGQYNRYELVIATAKCARMVTDEYVRQRETAEKAVAGVNDGDKNLSNMIDKEYRDVKAVKVAINHIHSGDFTIHHPEEPTPDEVVEE
jgi:DNA-directed RNA polymerase subunit K/omega